MSNAKNNTTKKAQVKTEAQLALTKLKDTFSSLNRLMAFCKEEDNLNLLCTSVGQTVTTKDLTKANLFKFGQWNLVYKTELIDTGKLNKEGKPLLNMIAVLDENKKPIRKEKFSLHAVYTAMKGLKNNTPNKFNQ